jgi:hypothetical protein
MATSDQFRYDIAFSFSGGDEAAARELNDLLASQFRTFIYSDADKQAGLVGTDGEEKFGEVFGRDALTVAVLYRKGWGASGFTAAEATAMRNRAYSYGWDFATFIALDSSPVLPPWFPRNRIWFDLERFGIETAAAILAARIREAGGEPVEQTVESTARRTKAAMDDEARRLAFLTSQDGINAMTEEFAGLKTALRAAADEGLDLVSFESPNLMLASVTCGRRSTTVVLDQEYYGTTRGSCLRVVEHVRTSGQPSNDESREYRFDRLGQRQGWRPDEGPETLTESKKLAAEIVKRLLDLRRADVRRDSSQALKL